MSLPKYLSASEQTSQVILVVTGNLTTWTEECSCRAVSGTFLKKTHIVLSFMCMPNINDETLFTIYWLQTYTANKNPLVVHED